jgi:hypothetical protein
MKLYHYTSITLGEAILSSAIKDGHLMHSDGGMSRGVVWLTTDPRPAGHGLLLGGEQITASQVAFSERATGRPAPNCLATHNKTQLRISVELDSESDPRLMSFMSYCKTHETKQWSKMMGLSCLIDVKRTPTKDLRRLMRTTSTKETTWWLSFSPVRPDCFVSVDVNVKCKFEPYDFERHGREQMRRDGFAFPSALAQAELGEIVEPSHQFEQTKAFVFCENPDKPPKVVVRGGSMVRAFEIGTRALVVGDVDQKTVPLQAWIARHEEELRACWCEAVKLFDEFHPNHRSEVVPDGV